MADVKRSTSFRLSDEARTLIVRLAELHGVSHAGVLEMAVRLLARRDLPPASEEPSPQRGKRKE